MTKLQKGIGLIGVLLIIVLVSVVGIGIYVYLNRNANNPFIKFVETASKSMGVELPNANVEASRKTRHFAYSSPTNGEVFATFPYGIVIDFTTELFDTSSIKLSKNGQEISTIQATLGENKKSLLLTLPITLDDGTYRVDYKECLSDGSCETGNLSFIVDTSRISEYKDMTSQSDIAISMQKLAFNPEKIIIKKGTKVTWVNEEATSHEVNSDPHPGHNLYVGLNSEAIAAGEKFIYSFYEPVEFPYHCSFHYPQMTGRIIVVE